MICPKCGKKMLIGELKVRGTCGYCWEIELYEKENSSRKPFMPASLKIRDIEKVAWWCPHCEIILLEYGTKGESEKEDVNA